VNGAELGLALSVLLACAVEAVEALTIVLAVGTTRSWSSAIGGVGMAVLMLAVVVVGLGSALTALPIDALRVAIGGLLLIFGLQWLRKAILRAAGLKAKHDERETYRLEAAAAQAAGERPVGFDGYSFAISFKGVLLEGLEVAFIVLTFGANQHRVGLAAAAAGLAVLLVVLAGVALRAPLARVPENAMKFAVGVTLSSFGMFWGAEGAGASWPGGEAALLAIVPGVLLVAIAMAWWLGRWRLTAEALAPLPSDSHSRRGGRSVKLLRSGLLAVWEFVVGDDWRTAVGVALALTLTAAIAKAGISAWWLIPVAVVMLLALSLRRAMRLK
jgi:uncharacterized membrane protein